MVKSKFMKQFIKGELEDNQQSKEIQSDYINKHDDILSLQNSKYGHRDRGLYFGSEYQDM